MKQGVDVSSNNGVVDWQLLKDNGIEFAIIRCGFGNDEMKQDDSQFINNVRKCEELGICYGIYLYSYALNLDEARSEASHVLRLVKECGDNFNLGIWFDMEDADQYKARHGMPSNELLVDICYEFCSIIEEHNYYTGIYANLNWLTTKINSSKLDRFDKWVAQWADKCTYTGNYSMWQYTSNFIFNNKRFDANYMIKEIDGDIPEPQPTEKNRVMYQVYTNHWLPDVIDYNNYDTNGYAGIFGQAISGFRANLNKGNIFYKVHTKNGRWLGEIRNREKENKYGDDFAGILGKTIDGIMIKSDVGTAKYRVHTKNGKWLGWITQYNEKDSINGYAGIFGKEIDAIQVEII